MSEMKKLNEGAAYAHATIGNPALYSGKAFLRDALALTGTEISFGTLEPGQEVPFFHSHKGNEEVYIILSGDGRFQVGEEVFAIAPGSVVRVSTGAPRNLRNTSDAAMTYICIQAREGSLEACTADDAVITDTPSRL